MKLLCRESTRALSQYLQVCGLSAVGDGLDVEIDEPDQRVLVHGLDVGQVTDAEEQDGGMGGHRPVAIASLVNLLLCGICYLLLG